MIQYNRGAITNTIGTFCTVNEAKTDKKGDTRLHHQLDRLKEREREGGGGGEREREGERESERDTHTHTTVAQDSIND